MEEVEKVLRKLKELATYIRDCRRKTPTGCREYEQFGDWLDTIFWVCYQIEEAMREENDGK